MPSATYALIREAIVRKQQVAAIYQERLRIMCPMPLVTNMGVNRRCFSSSAAIPIQAEK